MLTNAGIALIDALHDGREATVHKLVDETGLSTSQIYRTADELHSAGLIGESRGHHNHRILCVTGHPVIEAYRNLTSTLGHVDWPDLLSPATIRICWFLGEADGTPIVGEVKNKSSIDSDVVDDLRDHASRGADAYYFFRGGGSREGITVVAIEEVLKTLSNDYHRRMLNRMTSYDA